MTQPPVRRPRFSFLPDTAWIGRQFTLDADAIRDATHALRMLRKAPGFTAIALLVFAVGIGATTAIVSVADALFLRRVSIPEPERVMTIWQYNRDTGTSQGDVAPGNALDWIKRTGSFAAIAMAEPWTMNTTLPGRDPEYLVAARVSDQFFTVLGTPMLLGRAFLPHEYQRGSGRVVILSHRLWTDRFGSDPSIVGQSLRLDDDDAYTVVGVMPPRVALRLFNDRATRPEPLTWLPKQGYDAFEPNMRAAAFWNVLGRLRSGVTENEARAELDAISAQLAREYPQTNSRIAAQVVPLRTHLSGSFRDVLPLLIGAAAILLLIACANVANLLLARGAARAGELAVRQALGASRAVLARQLLIETLVLATAGGAVGLMLARWMLDVIARLRPGDVGVLDYIPIDARAALIACGITLIAAIIAGLTPSLQLSRPAAASVLKEGRSSTRRGARGALVIVEVAAAVMLAVGAGLLVRSFILIQRVDPGFSRDDVAVLQVFASPRLDTPQKRVVFFEQALERMRALPGVAAAGGVTSMPFGEAKVIVRGPIAVSGRPAPSGEASIALTSAVAGDYFTAMGVPLLKGRLFDVSDNAASRQVVVVSRSAAQQFWPASDPVGSRVRFRFTGTAIDAEVVGVVGDVRHEALDGPAAAEVFLPYAESGFRALTLVVRTSRGSPANLETFKQQIWALDPLQAIYHTARLDGLVSKTLIARRFSLFLLGGFALAALVLASAGVYGVMSFTTSQRTREFGVRMAVGATRRQIATLVLRDGLQLAGIGVAAGILLALPLSRLLRTLVFGITETDPLTFLFVSLTLVLVATAACYLPARRAINVDPVRALRIE